MILMQIGKWYLYHIYHNRLYDFDGQSWKFLPIKIKLQKRQRRIFLKNYFEKDYYYYYLISYIIMRMI